MHRFFLTDTALELNRAVDLSPLAGQLARVLRLQPGARVEVLDGEGATYTVKLTALSPRAAQGLVLSARLMTSEPGIKLTLYQCSLKADKFEWVLQKGTELGVGRFAPVISRRSVVRPAAALLKKYDRWRAIVREAAEQSGRGRLPLLADPVDFDAALNSRDALRLLSYESAGGAVLALGQAVEHSGIGPHPLHENDNSRPNPGMRTPPHVSLMIGPEGGFDEIEIAAAQSAGWRITTLGPRILRAETAALAAITVIMERAGEMG